MGVTRNDFHQPFSHVTAMLLQHNRLLLSKIMIWGAVNGIPLNLVLEMIMEAIAYNNMESMGIILPLVFTFSVPALILFYAIGVCLININSHSQKLLNIFSLVGKMALTNYLILYVI